MLKMLLGNMLLLVVATCAVFAFLEFVVFRHWLVPSDLVPNVTINDVVRYRPNTVAVMRNPDEAQHRVTINREGWNSTKAHYAVEKTPGVLRIAVVGDSYVQAATVDVKNAFPEVIERDLKAHGVKAEVYRFGVDGAPLSQYLYMLRNEVARYHPDVVVVQLVHNDFDETYRMLSTRVASTFMKVEPDGKGGFREVAPTAYDPDLTDRLRELSTFRYLYYTTGLFRRARFLADMWFGRTDSGSPEEYTSSAVDIRNLDDPEKMRLVTRYVLEQMKRLAAKEGFKLALAMDGVREAIYSGAPRSNYRVAMLNQLAADEATALDLPFLDLQDPLQRCHAEKNERLEFKWDWHWNVLGNQCVGRAITDFLLNDPRLLGKPQA